MTLHRTDIHRPSVINPAEYDWVGFEYTPRTGDAMGDAMATRFERERIKMHMDRTGGTYSRHAHGGNCMVCGNSLAIYTVLFYHALTNSYVRMGQDCAAKCDGLRYDEGAFNRFRSTVHAALEAQAGKRKAAATLAEHGLTDAWTLYSAEGVSHTAYEESTILDIVGKLVKYGSISDKQMAFIGRLLGKIKDREAIAANRAAENAAAEVIPEDIKGTRAKVTGTVLSVKFVDSAYGTTEKMLVKTDAGWKLWLTVPRSISPERGNRVEFEAHIEASRDDPKFGFGSRPNKARIIEAAAVATA